MKKLAVLLMTAVLLNTPNPATCKHIHDEECGYDPITEEGCTHQCEDVCGDGIMPLNGGSGCAFCPD